MPAITAGTIAPGVLNPANTANGQVCYGNNTTLNTHQQGCFWEPLGSNITTGAANPSQSTDGGNTNSQNGLFYNWCAAMNGQAAACQTGAATQPNQSINDGTNIYNICPKGWRLPTGEATTGEFTLLNNLINGGLTNTDTGLLAVSSFMRGGSFGNGSFSVVGTWGYYWSSTVNTAAAARNFGIGAATVLPASSNNKGLGLAIRCVAP